MPATPVFSRVDTVVLRVADRVTAVEWYRTKLGFQVLFQDEAAGLAVLHMGRDATITFCVAVARGRGGAAFASWPERSRCSRRKMPLPSALN